MSDLQLHDNGWLSLPLGLRQRLGLQTGDQLQLEMMAGGLRLRPAGKEAKSEVAQPVQARAVQHEPPAKQGRGRPRKQVQADLPVIERQAELSLKPAKVRLEGKTSTAASTGKRAMRGLFPGLRIGGRRKSEPAGTG
jgi:bifunctional DNA-binding transcriptional regulator/antitoxin component of YhaV-PrlF toxin-antitoxin module